MNHGYCIKAKLRMSSFKPKIAIIGASGFVGSALVERLFFNKGYDFGAFIHSYGNAARLTRFPIRLKAIDILNYNQVNRALYGYNIVINCSKGGSAEMLNGLKNIIKASKKNMIKKFIHISSVAIYGDDPPPETKDEAAKPDPGSNLYGTYKFKQENMVFKLHTSGIPSIILCPGNIIGPYSIFLLEAAQKLLSKEIVLVDDGVYPTNLIHVDNLVEAILTAIETEEAWGERYFINEIEQTTWKEFYEELMKILGLSFQIKSISRDEVLKCLRKDKSHYGFSDNIRILVSGEFREALSMFPAFEKLNRLAYKLFARLNPNIQIKLRQKLEKPINIEKEIPGINLDNRYIKVQIRQYYHSPEKIVNKLNYTPLLNYEQRMRSIESWFRYINIVN